MPWSSRRRSAWSANDITDLSTIDALGWRHSSNLREGVNAPLESAFRLRVAFDLARKHENTKSIVSFFRAFVATLIWRAFVATLIWKTL
jgi:hypothetical protein